jgi:hypothetical protein
MKGKRQRTQCPDCPERCFCGSSEGMEQNHPGGHNHVPWLLLPFCGKDHAEFHVMCRRAGVDFRYTSNKSTALIQALKAMLVGVWMVLDMLEKHLKSQSGDSPTDDTDT